MLKKILALALACALLLGSVAYAQDPASSVTLTYWDNPTTGYSWTYTVSDDTLLSVTDNGYTADANASQAAGVGGTHSWTLAGKAEGDVSITFQYGQAWEGGEQEDPFTIAYHVDASLALERTEIDGLPERYQPEKGVVALFENATTGYQWAYTADVSGILAPEWDAYIAPDTEAQDGETKVGESGYHVWIFNAEKPGKVTLTFTYVRSWETDVKPEATVTYTFDVSDNLTVQLTESGGDYEAYEAR